MRAGPSTLRIRAAGGPEGFDPAANYDSLGWQLEYATCAKLLNYADIAGRVELVPEIAAQLPKVSADGRQYTFSVRGNFRFSPPSNAQVTAADIKRTFERALDPLFFGDGEGPARYFMQDLVAIDLPSEDKIRFTLAAPSGDFMHRVAMPFFCVVPPTYTFGAHDEPPPTAGPYYVSTFVPPEFDAEDNPIAPGEVVLERNPNYRGQRPAGYDRIEYAILADWTPDDLISGAVDYAPEGVGRQPSLPDLLAAYGPGTSPQRLFVDPQQGINYVFFNTSRVTVKVRQAVNFAIDRAAMAGVNHAAPNDNYLPPGIDGYQGTHIYPLAGPDVAQAQALLGGAHPSLVLYTRNGGVTIANIVAANLAAVGIDVTVVPMSGFEFFQRINDPNEPYDLALLGWLADYPDPFDFLNVLLKSDSPNNAGHFADPTLDARMTQAATLLGSARTAAYAQLNLDLMDAAPLAVFGNSVSFDFFSAHVGCQVYQPMLGIDLAALCPR